MLEASTDPIAINLPDAFPWGVALIGIEGCAVLATNKHMSDLYGCEIDVHLDDLFHLDGNRLFSRIVSQLGGGHSWKGRIFPRHSRHGIASVEVMLQRENDDDQKVWLYTLEHPRVDDEIRYSSRSELKMLRVLLDNTLEYIYFRDVRGHFILTNKAFRGAVSDGDKTPYVDNTIQDFVSRESAEWFASLDRELEQSGHAVVNEVASVTLNSGLQHWLQLSVVPVKNGEGEMIGTLSVARDISELKRSEEHLRHAIEQARAASKAKGEFLAAMSHEIRTPINGIIGASELCEETRLDREQRGYLDTILQCGNTLLSLVNDVLDFSKIEAGQLNLEKLNFMPRTLMENVAESFVQETRKKNVELITAYDSELPSYIMGDPTRLKQVLNNLVSNAVKFTESGEIVIRAETLRVTEQAARVRFSVSDTGIGIAEDRQQAIFESFTQEDMSTTRKYGGTGLGLSISQDLVELMGGKIVLKSEVGKGAVFSFEVEFELSAYHGAEAVPYNPELAGMRVLIVDDNETNRDIYSQMCAGWGYRNAIAHNGSVAIEQLEKAVQEGDPYELVILDQQMPGLSGLDVAGLIVSRPELKKTRLILLSSSLDKNEAERASAIGVARALSKPVKRHTLLEVILETFELGYKGEPLSADHYPVDSNASLDVLLVEDNPVNQIVAKQRLKKLGHAVTLAEDSMSALREVGKKRFDCILMDIQMPGMDGFETTAAIRKLESEQKLEPHYIVAMTAHAMEGDRERCLSAGMDSYIAKPFRAKILKEVLNVASSRKKPVKKEQRRPFGSGSEFVFKDYLDSLDEEDREDVLVAAEIFLQNIDGEISRLEKAISGRDFKEVYFHAHSMKSIVGIFGHEAMATMLSRLEEACEAQAAERVAGFEEEVIGSLRDLAGEVQATLDGTASR